MLYKYLLELGYTESEIDIIINRNLLYLYKDENLFRKFKSNYEYLLNIGYSKKDLKKFTFVGIFTYKVDAIERKINDLMDLEYSFDEVKKMTVKFPRIFGLGINNINNKRAIFEKLGLNNKEINSMTVRYPALYGYGEVNINHKIEYLISLGYSDKDVVRMIKNLPEILAFSIDTINRKIERLINLGYSKEEVILMTSSHSALYSLSIDYIKNKFNELVLLGFSEDEIRKMTVKFPVLYSLSIDNISRKKEFYDSINLTCVMLLEPKYIMQSVDLSYARYRFLTDMGLYINIDNYRILFVGQKQFKNKFGKNNDELIELYSYDKYLEGRCNKNRIMI